MDDFAIECRSVWKSYRVYHQQSNSLKERIITRRNSYDEFWALKDVNLEIPRGTTTGIVGSNGSGKSTMLKVLARILTPNRGSVSVRGTMSSLLELGTGFHPELTGTENVYLAGSLMGQNVKSMKSKYDAIVDFAGIEEFMDLPVKNYSSGMYARLAFAVAISVDPEILMIDEVLSVGDEEFQTRCYDRISEFRAQGRTVVIVSHSLDSIRSLCDHAVWLEKGVVRTVGPANDVVSSYMSEVHASDAIHQELDVTDAHGGRWGTQQVEVVSVDISGRDGDDDGAVRTSKPMSIDIGYRVNEQLADLSEFVCGVAVYRADTQEMVFGQNTEQAQHPIQLSPDSDRGTIRIDIDDLPLLPGIYQVTIGLHDRGSRHVYDWHERRYQFTVFKNPQLGTASGIVRVPYRWSISSSFDPVRR